MASSMQRGERASELEYFLGNVNDVGHQILSQRGKVGVCIQQVLKGTLKVDLMSLLQVERR